MFKHQYGTANWPLPIKVVSLLVWFVSKICLQIVSFTGDCDGFKQWMAKIYEDSPFSFFFVFLVRTKLPSLLVKRKRQFQGDSFNMLCGFINNNKQEREIKVCLLESTKSARSSSSSSSNSWVTFGGQSLFVFWTNTERINHTRA